MEKIDTLVAHEVMGFAKAKYFKDGAGCYPADATPVYAATCWGTKSKGGTYPFLAGDTLFRGVKGGFGEHWAPTERFEQALEVADHLARKGFTLVFTLTKQGGSCKIMSKRGEMVTHTTDETLQKAICRAALDVVRKKGRK